MSIEYFAPICLSPGEVELVCDALPNEKFILVSTPDRERILLRFSARPQREDWPEDIEVTFTDSIGVTVHSGTVMERQEFVRHLEDSLLALGYELEFEEC